MCPSAPPPHLPLSPRASVFTLKKPTADGGALLSHKHQQRGDGGVISYAYRLRMWDGVKSLFVNGSLLYLDVLMLVSAHGSCFQNIFEFLMTVQGNNSWTAAG